MVMYMVMLIFTMVQLLALLVLRVFLLARDTPYMRRSTHL